MALFLFVRVLVNPLACPKLILSAMMLALAALCCAGKPKPPPALVVRLDSGEDLGVDS